MPIERTEASRPFKLPFRVAKLTAKGERFELLNSSDNIATDFAEILEVIYFIKCTLFRNIYSFIHPVKYLSCLQDCFVSGLHPFNTLTTNVPVIQKPLNQLTGCYMMGTLVIKGYEIISGQHLFFGKSIN